MFVNEPLRNGTSSSFEACFIVIVGEHPLIFDFEKRVMIVLRNCVDVIFLMNHFNSLKEDDFLKTV